MKNEKNLKTYLTLCEQGKNRKEISETVTFTLTGNTKRISNIGMVTPKG